MTLYGLVTLGVFIVSAVFLAKDGAEPGEISAGALVMVIFWPVIAVCLGLWLLGWLVGRLSTSH